MISSFRYGQIERERHDSCIVHGIVWTGACVSKSTKYANYYECDMQKHIAHDWLCGSVTLGFSVSVELSVPLGFSVPMVSVIIPLGFIVYWLTLIILYPISMHIFII